MNWLNEIETPCQQSNDEPTIPCQTEEPGDNLCEVQPSQFGAHQHDTGSGSSITDITNVGDVHNFTEHEGEAQFGLSLDTPEPHLFDTDDNYIIINQEPLFPEPLHDEGDDINYDDSDVSTVLSWHSFPTSNYGSSEAGHSCTDDPEDLAFELA